MRRKVVAVALAAAFALAALAAVTARSVEAPRVTAVEPRLVEIAPGDIGLVVAVRIENPNPVPMRVDAIELDIFAGGRKIGNATEEAPATLPANGEAVILVRAEVPTRLLLAMALEHFLRGERTVVGIEGEARVGYEVLNYPVPISAEREVRTEYLQRGLAG